MDKIELWRLIKKLEKEYGINKIKRLIYVVLGYAALLIQVSYLTGSLHGLPFGEVIGEFIGCIFISGIFVWINLIIFSQLFRKSESENKTIEYYKKELEKLEKDQNRKVDAGCAPQADMAVLRK